MTVKFMKDIKIMVAAHKQYRMPDDAIYLPVHVGAALSHGEALKGMQRDDAGDNISAKNRCYCELTAVYWAWKNLRSDYIGLAHYRRHFRGRLFGAKFNKILTGSRADKLLADCKVLLPKKRRYYIETNYQQYVHAHHSEGIMLAREVIDELCPDYLLSFDKVMGQRSGHRFNMFVMRRDIFDKYCTWLFAVLFTVESRLDISMWNETEQRVYGYLAERLLDVWLTKNAVAYRDIPYMFMENQHWCSKIIKFLKRKFSSKQQ